MATILTNYYQYTNNFQKNIEEIEQTEEYKEYLNYESELDAAHQKNNVSEEAKQNEEPKIQEKMQEEIAKRKAMMSDTES